MDELPAVALPATQEQHLELEWRVVAATAGADEPVPAALLAVHTRAWRRYAAGAAIFALGIGLGWFARGEFVAPQVVQLSFARQAATAHVVYAPEVRHPVE